MHVEVQGLEVGGNLLVPEHLAQPGERDGEAER